jgi:hypothetical protein
MQVFLWYTSKSRPLTGQLRHRKEGYTHMFNSFIISVIAGILTHYLSKWLDRNNGGK